MVRHRRARVLRRLARVLVVQALLLALLLASTGCGNKKDLGSKPTPPPAAEELSFGLTKAQAAQPLVKVGDTTITLGQFADRLGGQSPYLRARYNSPERRREFLDNMVRFELLASEADKRGYNQKSDVVRVRKQMMVQQMMQELFEKDGVQLADITDLEITQYYNGNKAEFEKPAQVRASHIQCKDKATASKVLELAKQHPEDMQAFRKLAEQYNQDPETKDNFGDLRFFSETADATDVGGPERPDALRKAAFTLKNVGDVYPEILQTEHAFHVLKLTGKREAMTRTLEDARRLIQNRIWRKKREDAIENFVAELRKKAEVKESPELLAKVQVQPDPTPAGKAEAKHEHDHDEAVDESEVDGDKARDKAGDKSGDKAADKHKAGGSKPGKAPEK